MADILKYRKLDGTEVEVANNSTIALGHTEASIEFTVDLDLVAVLEGETRGWFGSVGSTTSAPQQSGVYGFSISLSQGQTQSVTITTVDAKSTLLLSQSIFSRFTDIFNITVSRAAAPTDSTTDSTGPNFLVYPDSDAALAIVNATFALTDSATTFGIVDSDYVHLRQNRDFDFLTNLPKTIDSAGITRSLFDSDVRKSISSVDAGGDGSLTYNNTTGVITYTGPSASEVRAHFGASQDLAYDASTGIFSIDVEVKYTKDNFDSDLRDRLTTTNTDSIAEGSNLYFTTQRARNTINVADLGGDGSLTYDSAKGKLSYTGPLSSEVRAHFTGDKGIVYNNGSGVINIDSGNIKGMFSASGDLTYNSATGQFSFDVEQVYTKTNFDSDLGDANTGQLPEGTNLYYTTARADSAFDASFALASTDSLSEGNTNLYYTTARADSAARSALIAVDAGGDGSFAYDSATGKFTYTGPSATEVRSHFSAQGDLTYDSSTGVFQFDVEQVYTKANFDSDFNVAIDSATTSDLSEGSNLYYTPTRVDSDFDARLAIKTTTNLTEGNNLYYTTARADSAARSALIAVDAGGDGSFTYDSATGKFTYVGPSASEVRSHFSAQGDLSYDSTTGVFQFDVEQVYTKANFDSDFNVAIDSASTSDLSEGTNLYYTNARADARVNLQTGANLDLSQKSTSDLSEGTNKYYTKVRVDSDFDASFALASTDSLSEGSTNLYFTNERVDDRVGALITGGVNVTATYDDAAGTLEIKVPFENIDDRVGNILTAGSGININYDDPNATITIANTLNTSDFPDSAFVTSRPVSTFTNDALYLDSTTAQNLINASYIQSNQIQYNTSDFLDSTTVTGVVNNTYVQARQVKYNTSDFTDSAFVTGLPVSTFTNDKNYLDSTYAAALIDSAHIKAVVDSAYVQLIQADLQRDSSFISSIVTGGTLNMGANNIITTGKVLFANVYSQLSDLPSASTYHGMFAHVHGTGKAYYAHAGAWVELANNSQLSNSANWNTAFGWGDHASAGYQLAATALDSAMVYRFTIDSTRTTALVDAAYVQARQQKYNTSDFTDSAFVTGLPISTFTNDANYLDSTTVTDVINTAYVRARQALIDSDLTKLLVDSAYIQLRDRFQDSSLVTSTVDSAYINARVSTVDSAQVQAIIDSSYLEVIIDSDYVTARAGVILDSASIASGVILTTVDTAYVQARQQKYNTSDFTDSAFVTGLPVSTFTNDVKYLDSTTVQGVINAAYVQANQNDYLDSTLTSQLIDSAYIALRTTAGTDSATVIGLIDSDYVSSRVVAFANPIFTEFKYITESAGQVVFEGNDANGNALSIETGNHAVFVNGIRLLPSDFTADVTNNRITLDSTGSTSDEIVISTIKGKNALAGISIIDSDYIASRTIAVAQPQFVNYKYNADGNQTEFGGGVADVNGQTVALSPGNFTVFLNGIKLLDSDFTANTSTNVITLNSGATLNDELVIQTIIGQNAVAGVSAVDSSYVQLRVPASYIQSKQTNFLDSSLTSQLIDSAYIALRTTAGTDSATVIGLIDSDYVAARVTGVVTPQFTDFRYKADSGQTLFSGADLGGTSLNLRTNNFNVYLNGIKLIDSDFTASISNNTITLTEGADSGDDLVITTVEGDIIPSDATVIDSAYVQARQEGVNATFKDYKFVATANQTVFSGNDANGATLSFETNKFHVLLNGIRLDASDFTESADNNKITLATGAAVSDELIVSTIGTEKTTTLTSITSTVDSAYIEPLLTPIHISSGNVGIGTTSPSTPLHVIGNNGILIDEDGGGDGQLYFGGISGSDRSYIARNADDFSIWNVAQGTMKFGTSNDEKMTILADGNVGIGTNSPSDRLEISRTSTDQTVGLTITNEQAGGYGSGIVFRSKRSDTGDLLAAGEIQVTGENSWNGAGNVASMMEFFTQKDGTLTRHMSLSKNGVLMIGHNNYTPNSHTGVFLNGGSGKGFFTVDGDAPLAIHRLSSDGNLIELRQDNNTEGTISVSGSTVSYNGFSGQHETSGIATNTEIGTVVSTIDELDIYFSGDKKGQTRADHAKVKVSDSAGDNCVYGVVSRFDSDGKAFIASVGIGTIRVTGACAKGDLLESNGDGTAKVQSDDIIRSKTIGKVTIGNSNSGVKLVSCVLYCG